MWKQCEHWPHTSGQSSPGTLPVKGPGLSLRHTHNPPSLPTQAEDSGAHWVLPAPLFWGQTQLPELPHVWGYTKDRSSWPAS